MFRAPSYFEDNVCCLVGFLGFPKPVKGAIHKQTNKRAHTHAHKQSFIEKRAIQWKRIRNAAHFGRQSNIAVRPSSTSLGDSREVFLKVGQLFIHVDAHTRDEQTVEHWCKHTFRKHVSLNYPTWFSICVCLHLRIRARACVCVCLCTCPNMVRGNRTKCHVSQVPAPATDPTGHYRHAICTHHMLVVGKKITIRDQFWPGFTTFAGIQVRFTKTTRWRKQADENWVFFSQFSVPVSLKTFDHYLVTSICSPDFKDKNNLGTTDLSSFVSLIKYSILMARRIQHELPVFSRQLSWSAVTSWTSMYHK